MPRAVKFDKYVATNAENAALQPVVEVAQGRLLGSRIDRLYAFRGVPYAIANRFGPPQPVPASTGIREAVRPRDLLSPFGGDREFRRSAAVETLPRMALVR